MLGWCLPNCTVLQSRYYVHFRANTLGKGMNPLIYCSRRIDLTFNNLQKVDMPLNKETKPNQLYKIQSAHSKPQPTGSSNFFKEYLMKPKCILQLNKEGFVSYLLFVSLQLNEKKNSIQTSCKCAYFSRRQILFSHLLNKLVLV